MIRIFIPNDCYLYAPTLGVELHGHPPVSVTGSYCALHCKHCSAKILERMVSAETPQKLMRIAENLHRQGAGSVLISGGSNQWGQVPFEEFVDAIKYAKKLGLRVYMHTGLVDEYRAQLLREAEIDAALIDFTVEERIVREVLNLKLSPENFIDSIRNLSKFSVRVVPHIVVGMYCGEPSGEKQAIDVLKNLNPDAVVIVVFTPLPGTPFENCSPPQPQYISEVVEYAKSSLPHTPLSYGCMKPRGESYQPLEIKAIQLGFEGLSLPSYTTIEYIIGEGMAFKIMQECCAYIVLER